MTVIYCIPSTEVQLSAYSRKQFYFHSQKFSYGETNLLLLLFPISISLFPDFFFTPFLYSLGNFVTHNKVSVVCLKHCIVPKLPKLAFHVSRPHCQATFKMFSMNFPQSFSCQITFYLFGPKPAWLHGAIPSWGRSPCLPLLNFLRYLLPIYPACQAPFQHAEHLPPAWCHLRSCRECTLPRDPTQQSRHRCKGSITPLAHPY